MGRRRVDGKRLRVEGKRTRCETACCGDVVPCPEPPSFSVTPTLTDVSPDCTTWRVRLCLAIDEMPEGYELHDYVAGDTIPTTCEPTDSTQDGNCFEFEYSSHTCCAIAWTVIIRLIERPECTASVSGVEYISLCDVYDPETCAELECEDRDDLPESITINLTGDVENVPDDASGCVDPPCIEHPAHCADALSVTVDRTPGTCSYEFEQIFTDDIGCRTGIFGCNGPGSTWQHYDTKLSAHIEFTGCTFSGWVRYEEEESAPCITSGSLVVFFNGCRRGDQFIVTGVTDSSLLGSTCAFFCKGTAVTGVSLSL